MARQDQHDWEAAWEAAYPGEKPAAEGKPERRRRSPRTRSVLLATGMLVLGVTGVGVAANGDVLREGQRNGTATRETEIVSRTNETGQPKGGYSTRQSNLSRSGGGAIYGCRAAAETQQNQNTNPCLRSNNLSNGLSFEFQATQGNLGGTIDVGNGGDDDKPFTTNATGVATGLNADEVDGQSAEEIVAAGRAGQSTRWALVNEAGQIEAQTGGFTLVNCFQANDNCYINAGEDVRNNGIHAQIAIANTDGSPVLSGETGTAPCGAAFVNCAPPGTEDNNVLVVAPRQSDGTADAANRARFYVYVTGSEAAAG